MKALADNNLRTAEVSLFNGENRGPRSIPVPSEWASHASATRRLTAAPTPN